MKHIHLEELVCIFEHKRRPGSCLEVKGFDVVCSVKTGFIVELRGTYFMIFLTASVQYRSVNDFLPVYRVNGI